MVDPVKSRTEVDLNYSASCPISKALCKECAAQRRASQVPRPCEDLQLQLCLHLRCSPLLETICPVTAVPAPTMQSTIGDHRSSYSSACPYDAVHHWRPTVQLELCQHLRCSPPLETAVPAPTMQSTIGDHRSSYLNWHRRERSEFNICQPPHRSSNTLKSPSIYTEQVRSYYS